MTTSPEVNGSNVVAVEPEQMATIYRPDVARSIKLNVARVWERVKQNRKLNQSELAKALDVSQGAISKLLNNLESHPWTETHLRKFADFCQVSPKELIGENERLIGFFSEWNRKGLEPEDAFVEECIDAIANYFSSRGLPVQRSKLAGLAAKVASKLVGTNPDAETMNKQIERIVLENAVNGG